MGTIFVFDPDASYGRIGEIRAANEMPPGAHFVASVAGPWRIFSIVDFEDLRLESADRVEGLAGGGTGDPETATVIGFSKVKRSVYRNAMAFVRIDVQGDTDPVGLLPAVRGKIGSDEADAVIGAFDILACAVADDEAGLAAVVTAIRGIDGVKTARPFQVIDFVTAEQGKPNHIPA